eukprot:PhM_4_TR9746/c5_g1_i1/m.99885
MTDKLDTAGDNVKVVCRVRPFNNRELEIQEVQHPGQPIRSVIGMEGQETVMLDHLNDYAERERFKFDFSIWSIPKEQQDAGNHVSTQEDVFTSVGMPTIKQCWEGYNTCLFAYGQTGAGKTYTMMGPKEDPGIIPRLCKELFNSVQEQNIKNAERSAAGTDAANEVKEYSVEARFLEIYNEKVQDLLWELNDAPEKYSDKDLRVRNFPGRGPDVVGLTNVIVKDWEDCMSLIEHGIANRTVASTKMNDQSSRSHSVFRIIFTQITKVLPKQQFDKMQTLTRTSSINLVDLAGSERNKKSGAQGQQLKEAAAINKSLTVLKEVIDALVERKPHIPYRDSLLTWLLSESLGGNSKTFMMACASPHYDNAEETLNTLRYALRTQGIHNCAQINDSDDMKKLERLKGEISRLQGEIDKGPSIELQAELDAAKEAVLEWQAKLQDVELQARELEKAYQQERELKYAKAVQTTFRISRERRLTRTATELQRNMSVDLLGRSKERDILNDSVSRETSVLQNLTEEESTMVNTLRRQQSKIRFWKSSTSELEENVESELKDQLIHTSKEVQRHDAERKLKAMVGAMNNQRLRNELQERVANLIEDHENRRDAVVKKFSDDYNNYAEEASDKHMSMENEIAKLKRMIFKLSDELATVTAGYRADASRLEKEVAFLSREILEQNQAHQADVNKGVTDQVNRFDAKHALLKAQANKSTEEYRGKLQMKLAELAYEEEVTAVNAQGDIDDCNRRGEWKLKDVNAYWEAKMQQLDKTKADELRGLEEMHTVMEDYLREINLTEHLRPYSMEDVERALESEQLRPYVLAKDSGYHSVSPAVYSLSSMDHPFAASITEEAQQLMSTPRILHTTNMTAELAKTRAVGTPSVAPTPRTGTARTSRATQRGFLVSSRAPMKR